VYFRDDSGRLYRMPVGWTSAGPLDPFTVLAAGRCRFRLDDLLRLADLLEALAPALDGSRKENNAASVKRIPRHPRPAPEPSPTPYLSRVRRQRPKKAECFAPGPPDS
jgi:hypothetical protein